VLLFVGTGGVRLHHTIAGASFPISAKRLKYRASDDQKISDFRASVFAIFDSNIAAPRIQIVSPNITAG
jgi:hypothetical protein